MSLIISSFNMNIVMLNNEAVLTCLLRIILGLLFFFQGYDKVFKVKTSGVIKFFHQELGRIRVPNFIVVSSAWFTSYAELICGTLLILGLFKTYALYILSVDLILVTAAFSLIKPMWDMQLLFPRLILLIALLYLPSSWDVFSLDYLISR
jgi:putative oxidoreductase